MEKAGLHPEIEKAGQVKVGHYVNSVWMCDDCFGQVEGFGDCNESDLHRCSCRCSYDLIVYSICCGGAISISIVIVQLYLLMQEN
jgi:hypothetical protein